MSISKGEALRCKSQSNFGTEHIHDWPNGASEESQE